MVEDKTAVEDIIQECYLRIWENADYQNGEHLMGSLMLSVRYRCQTYLQSVVKRAKVQDTMSEMATLFEDPFEIAEKTHDKAELMNLIENRVQTLPPHLQTYYRLLRAGHDQQEISKIMKIQIGTVYHLRVKLRSKLTTKLMKILHKHRWTTIFITILASA